jgi:hypothetical protein
LKDIKEGYEARTWLVSLFLFLLLIFSAPLAAAGDVNPLTNNQEPSLSNSIYLNNLLKVAEEKELHKARYWQVLMHYKPTTLGFGTESLVDDPAFFLSPDGKKNPRAELQATIRAFFDNNTKDDQNAQCRFIARYTWLRKVLSIDESKLPTSNCIEYNDVMKKIQAKRAVLVFPAAHINSPASMFGHTLLRFDGERESKLISYAVNYAAHVEDTNGLIYAFKGIFGYYKGYYSVLPYYLKVQEYSSMDKRDMWEYELNLTEAEVEKLLMHLWELKDLYTYYYFFDENCSYTLLFLLEAARPELRLTDNPGFATIPVDTIRSVINNDVMDGIKYRPSIAEKIKRLAEPLDSRAQRLAKKIATQKLLPNKLNEYLPSKQTQIKTLELAAEYIQYKYSKEEYTKDEYKKLFLNTLKARGALGAPLESTPAERTTNNKNIITPQQPDKGHLTKKVTFGGGVKNNSWFTELKYRPAYHALLDPSAGYIEGSQIKFMELTMRYYPRHNRTELYNLELLNILSLAPRDRFFKPISWKVQTGFNQREFGEGFKTNDNIDHMVFKLNPGAGLTYKNILGTQFIMAETELLASGRFDAGYALGFGGAVGSIIDITERWRVELKARAMYFDLGDDHRSYEGIINQRFTLSQNSTLSLEINREKIFNRYSTDAVLAFAIFF